MKTKKPITVSDLKKKEKELFEGVPSFKFVKIRHEPKKIISSNGDPSGDLKRTMWTLEEHKDGRKTQIVAKSCSEDELDALKYTIEMYVDRVKMECQFYYKEDE